jgi:hypothetical protein
MLGTGQKPWGKGVWGVIIGSKLVLCGFAVTMLARDILNFSQLIIS